MSIEALLFVFAIVGMVIPFFAIIIINIITILHVRKIHPELWERIWDKMWFWPIAGGGKGIGFVLPLLEGLSDEKSRLLKKIFNFLFKQFFICFFISILAIIFLKFTKGG